MDLPDFSDTDFTAHKGVKKRPTGPRPADASTDAAGNAVSAEPPARRKPGPPSRGGRKPGPGKGAPRHAPRTGNHPKRHPATEKRQRSHAWAKSGEWKEPFLEYLADTGHQSAAAELAGVSPRTVQNHKAADPEFLEAYEDALELCQGRLYASIVTRGTKGKRKYAIINGERKFVGYEPSDLLAMFLMKKLDPRFRDSYDGSTNNVAVQMTQTLIKYLVQGEAGGVPADGPTFREFVEAGGGDMKVIEAETPGQRVERLRTELALAEAALPPRPEGAGD